MKHLLTAIACCFAVAGSAQFPYNPDSNGDQLIGAEDLLSLLPLYGSSYYPPQSSGTSVFNTSYGSTLGCEADTCVIYNWVDAVELYSPSVLLLPPWEHQQLIVYPNSFNYQLGYDFGLNEDYDYGDEIDIHHEVQWEEEFFSAHVYIQGPDGFLLRVR